MTFNSLHFVAFFLVVYGLYRVLPHNAQNWLLLVASYYFYAAWDWRFLGLLAGSTIVDFFCARYIHRQDAVPRRRAALVVSLSFNLGMLGVFKYFNFFADNLRALFAVVGWHMDPVTLRVILPIGISFYTFITMSYVIDVYRRQMEPTRNLRDFAVFVAYFPHLVAGPILRASVLLPQVVSRRRITREQVVEGLWLIGYGYFKKVFVADNLGHLADAVFAPTAHPAGFDVLLGLYAFAFQIYGDFAGYSDIARGTSKLLGIELNVNFRFPYLVRSPQAFWQHWHISLSTWLRDYLFLPLSFTLSRRLDGLRWLGLREDVWVYSIATMATMLLAGLWHGAAWNFVLWGMYQGMLLVIFVVVGQALRERRRRRRRAGEGISVQGRESRFRSSQLAIGRVRHALGVVAMFHLTCLGWLIFRSKSIAQIGDLTRALFIDFAPSSTAIQTLALPLLFYTAFLVAVQLIEARADDLSAVLRLPVPVRYALYVTMFYLVTLFGDFAGAQFIYFQF